MWQLTADASNLVFDIGTLRSLSIIRRTIKGRFLFEDIFTEAPTQSCSYKKVSENMQQIYKRTPMPKCHFNKAAK